MTENLKKEEVGHGIYRVSAYYLELIILYTTLTFFVLAQIYVNNTVLPVPDIPARSVTEFFGRPPLRISSNLRMPVFCRGDTLDNFLDKSIFCDVAITTFNINSQIYMFIAIFK